MREKLKEVSRDQFFQTVPRQVEMVALPELGKGVGIRIRSLTAKERADYEDEVRIKTKKGYDIDPVHLQEKLIIRAAVDEKGELLLTEEDMPRMAGMPAAVINRLFKVAQRLCGLNDDDGEAAEARLE